jgi:hypothetical protein
MVGGMRADGGTAWERAAPWAVAIGAVVSAALVLYATRRVGSPPLLQALFAAWVVAPFGLLAVGLARSPPWPAPARATMAAVSVIVAAVRVRR